MSSTDTTTAPVFPLYPEHARAGTMRVGDRISFGTWHKGQLSGVVATREPQYTQHTWFTLEGSPEKYALYSGTIIPIHRAAHE